MRYEKPNEIEAKRLAVLKSHDASERDFTEQEILNMFPLSLMGPDSWFVVSGEGDEVSVTPVIAWALVECMTISKEYKSSFTYIRPITYCGGDGELEMDEGNPYCLEKDVEIFKARMSEEIERLKTVTPEPRGKSINEDQ